jgi:hypothetical protein
VAPLLRPKALLDQYLKIRLSLRGGPARWRRFGYRTSVQLLDPCTFYGAWARMAILIRRRPRWGGLGPDDDVQWHRSIPATILLHARASRNADGELATQWCVPEGPLPMAYRAEPSSGLIVPAEGGTDLRLIMPRVPTPAGAGGGCAVGRVTVRAVGSRRSAPRFFMRTDPVPAEPADGWVGMFVAAAGALRAATATTVRLPWRSSVLMMSKGATAADRDLVRGPGSCAASGGAPRRRELGVTNTLLTIACISRYLTCALAPLWRYTPAPAGLLWKASKCYVTARLH